MKNFIIVGSILSLIIIQACRPAKDVMITNFDVEAKAIEKVMRDQEKAWSAGDIPAFMEGYWNSDKLTFGGKNGFTYGYDKVRYNYQKGYPSAEVMGKLNFEIIDIFPITQESAYVLGKYMLEAKDSNSSGYFTLVWKKIDGAWKIISDHTSG